MVEFFRTMELPPTLYAAVLALQASIFITMMWILFGGYEDTSRRISIEVLRRSLIGIPMWFGIIFIAGLVAQQFGKAVQWLFS